jgi:molybdenum cofactor synthesis domain-containing protein
VPLDCVKIDYILSDDTVKVRAEVMAIWKTGVEMEALVAASLAAITIYDMLKPIDKSMEVLPTQLLEKKGGKSDYKEKIPMGFKAAVIVTSDGTAAGKREDNSGKLICERLQELGIENLDYIILPDETKQIQEAILGFCAKEVDLILTTGGTGLGPRDVTVEATRSLIEREMPAVVAAMQSYGQNRTPYAMLSRAVAGVRGKTVIVNLPGSSRGTKECLNAIFPALLHVYKMMRGGGH